jgi:hypothetical protein
LTAEQQRIRRQEHENRQLRRKASKLAAIRQES